MILSDYYLVQAKNEFATMFKGRLAEFEDDDPAEMRVLVRLPEANYFSDVKVISALKVRENGLDPPMHFTEVERYTAVPEDAVLFYRFGHVFVATKDHDIRVNFFFDSLKKRQRPKEHIGSATLRLHDIATAVNEKKEVQLISPDGERQLRMKAEFAVEYTKLLSALLCIDVRMKVDKSEGWPFDTVRVFFVIFRWEKKSEQGWNVLYRSEVLWKPTDRPDANGAMIFQKIQCNLKKANGGVDDDRPLRFEFFQYQEGSDGLLLGYFTTSLRHLRQQKPGSKLKLQVNTYPQGELIGKLQMEATRITMNRHYFSLHADFGGVVKGDFVYFDISLTEGRKSARQKRRNKPRPFYKIVRYSFRGQWEDLYRSETPSHSFSDHEYKFKVAKLSKRKLTGGCDRASFLIVFYHEDRNRNQVYDGLFQTTVLELLEAAPGRVFEINSPTAASPTAAYIRMRQASRGDAFMYFAAQCVLEEPGTNTPSLMATDRASKSNLA